MDTERRLAAQGVAPIVDRHLVWKGALTGAGWAGALALGIVAVVLADFEAGAVAVGFAVSTMLLRFRTGRLGAVGIGLVSLITLCFMGAAALTNARIGSPMGWVLVTSALAAISIVGFVASVNRLWHGDRSSQSIGPLVLVGFAVIWIAGVAMWAGLSNGSQGADATVSLTAENVSFSVGHLAVSPGEVTVEMTNRDLFWHTFTIEELDVDLRVPVGAVRTFSFQASPGIYEFICQIPGHPEAGMKGTLVVADA